MTVGARVAAAGVAIVVVLAAGWLWLTHRIGESRAAVPAVAAAPVVSIVLPEETATLPATPAGELVTAKCTACHSAGMITQQPPMDAAKWTATVVKMREAYHAPIAPSDDTALAEALATLQRGGQGCRHNFCYPVVDSGPPGGPPKAARRARARGRRAWVAG